MSKAVVVFSGGQDSTTCLGWAKRYYREVECIAFRYGQKHDAELRAASAIAAELGVNIEYHDIPSLQALGDSALTTGGDVTQKHHRNAELPASFVPNRNALFLTIAHAYAQKVGANTIITGVCQTDYSGYPDCRQEFIDRLSVALDVGYMTEIEIKTPLMNLNKAQTFQMAKDCKVLDQVLRLSHTCYNNVTTMNEWGKGCGHCPACELRAKGWEEFKAEYE